ncbi:hypothetical protein BDQ17DRAFT_1360153, partial [Cyathus striatus]
SKAQTPLPLSLVRSSYFPDPNDRSTIQRLVSSKEMEISSLQLRLLHIRKFTAFQGSLLAPIRTLPNELLGEIFSLVHCGVFIDIAVGHGYIWNLRQVYDTPALWSKFKVAKMELCLENSSSNLLSVSIAAEHVMHHADRLSHLSIYVASTSVEELIQQRGLSRLRKLTIRGREWSTPSAFRFFRSASGLEHVHLICVNITNVLDLPLTKVKRIRLIPILRSAPNLEELHWITTKQVVLPLLHTMNVSRPEASRIWSTLVVPRLTNFRVQNFSNNVDFLLPLIQRSASQLLEDVNDLTHSNILQWKHPNSRTGQRQLPFLKKLMIQISYLMSVMRSRSPLYNAMGAGQDVGCTPALLSYVQCVATKYFSSYKEMKTLGMELGIEVDGKMDVCEELQTIVNEEEEEEEIVDEEEEEYLADGDF